MHFFVPPLEIALPKHMGNCINHTMQSYSQINIVSPQDVIQLALLTIRAVICLILYIIRRIRPFLSELQYTTPALSSCSI